MAFSTPTTPAIAETIEKLRDLLLEEYKSDFSFSIMGQGKILAASNNEDGTLIAIAKKETK